MAFSPDDKHLAVAGPTSDVQILDAGTGELVKICPGDSRTSRQAEIQSGWETTGGSGARVWSGALGRRHWSASPHVQGAPWCVLDIAFSPDGTRIASAGTDGRVKVWDVISDRDVIPIPVTRATGHLYRAFPRWTYRPDWHE